MSRASLPRAARVYLSVLPRFVRAQRGLHALFVGTALGSLDREALAAVSTAYYARQREPVGDRELPYADPEHVFSGFAGWEADAVAEHFPPGGRIVVTSAGAGREVAAALKFGFVPAGYEPDAALRAAGDAAFAARGLDVRLGACAYDAFPATGPADGVIVGWGSFSHIAGRGRRRVFLSAARAVLAPGAPLLVSYWSVPEARRYMDLVWRVSRAVRRLRRREPTEFGDILSPLYLHCFSAADVEAELADAGFTVVHAAGAPYPHAVARAV